VDSLLLSLEFTFPWLRNLVFCFVLLIDKNAKNLSLNAYPMPL